MEKRTSDNPASEKEASHYGKDVLSNAKLLLKLFATLPVTSATSASTLIVRSKTIEELFEVNYE